MQQGEASHTTEEKRRSARYEGAAASVSKAHTSSSAGTISSGSVWTHSYACMRRFHYCKKVVATDLATRIHVNMILPVPFLTKVLPQGVCIFPFKTCDVRKRTATLAVRGAPPPEKIQLTYSCRPHTAATESSSTSSNHGI
jgi:hypothetical protein